MNAAERLSAVLKALEEAKSARSRLSGAFANRPIGTTSVNAVGAVRGLTNAIRCLETGMEAFRAEAAFERQAHPDPTGDERLLAAFHEVAR